MFDFFKRKKNKPESPAPDAVSEVAEEQQTDTGVAAEPLPETAEAPVATAGPVEPVSALVTDTVADEVVSETEAVLQQAAGQIEESADEAVVDAAVADEPEVEEPAAEDTASDNDVMVPVAQRPVEEKKGFFGRMRAGLSKTRSNFTDGLSSLLLGKKEIDDDLMEELETQLIMADVGVEATTEIIGRLTKRVSRKELKDSEALYEALIEELQDMLAVSQKPLVIDSTKKPYVILMVGINGVGKTTTIGKLAKQFQNRGKSVMLAAGDTFRAAAVEQLQVWGERNNVPVVAQHTGADSASVLFDAVQAATSRKTDILIADTAGRLHTKDNLMQELEKVVRVMKKIDDTAPHEVMLVLDAGTGQNAVNQTKQFLQSVGVTGLTLTKLDGTAKGGIIFALAKQFGLPVRYIGVGEGIDDLRPFNADDFTRALFRHDEKDS
ncbi:MAG: signal recognition particle-docking protein FtsY [Thalassolituus sp.]|jgi:fused signal recognition particle receptor|uniref:signal recognition particle-docking protein FtsY n=1 Tax=Thalassolituus sp. TaxID=2030822 RepID=UPI003519B03A|nr:MAG: signal recognition particle-docking protein FtsY [Thalassolituus sp.]